MNCNDAMVNYIEDCVATSKSSSKDEIDKCKAKGAAFIEMCKIVERWRTDHGLQAEIIKEILESFQAIAFPDLPRPFPPKTNIRPPKP